MRFEEVIRKINKLLNEDEIIELAINTPEYQSKSKMEFQN